jgi:hypothetical protein
MTIREKGAERIPRNGQEDTNTKPELHIQEKYTIWRNGEKCKQNVRLGSVRVRSNRTDSRETGFVGQRPSSSNDRASSPQ